MRAIVYDRFGPPDVLELRQVEAPTKRSGHARVAVYAAALNPKDVLVRKGKMTWLTGGKLPRTPGYDFAGTLIDDAGDLLTGTAVFGMVQSHMGGTCADVVSVPVDELARRPDALSMAEAASLPLAALTALQGLRDELLVRPGHKVLLNGASGGVGTLAIQIARNLGCEVTAVCSGRNAELVTRLGAHHVVDYTQTKLTSLSGFDAIFDIFGSFRWEQARRSLVSGGRFCTTIPHPKAIARGVLRRARLHRAAIVVVRSRRADLDVLSAWADDGKLEACVDRVLELEDSITAHEHLETRRARGKVVLAVRAD